MIPLKIHTIAHIMMMICSALIHANDYDDCMRQITTAFGHETKATACIRYAVQFFRKTEYIKISPYDRPKYNEKGEMIPNYAMLYYYTMENNIGKGKMDAPDEFCENNYFDLMQLKCKTDLTIFGDSAIAAAKTALLKFKLAQFKKDDYVTGIQYSYMETICKLCGVGGLTLHADHFCRTAVVPDLNKAPLTSS